MNATHEAQPTPRHAQDVGVPVLCGQHPCGSLSLSGWAARRRTSRLAWSWGVVGCPTVAVSRARRSVKDRKPATVRNGMSSSSRNLGKSSCACMSASDYTRPRGRDDLACGTKTGRQGKYYMSLYFFTYAAHSGSAAQSEREGGDVTDPWRALPGHASIPLPHTCRLFTPLPTPAPAAAARRLGAVCFVVAAT